MIPTALASFFAKPLIKYGVPVLLIVVAVLGFWMWLGMHDRAIIRDERERVRLEVMEASKVAGDAATVNQMERNDAFEKSQADLANTSDPADYLNRLRAQQQRGKAAPASR